MEYRCATTVLLGNNDLIEELDRWIIGPFAFSLMDELIEA
jgi:hypothetical protein